MMQWRGKSGDRRSGRVKYCNNSSPCWKSFSPFGTGLHYDVAGLPLKRAKGFPRSQGMALIALSIVGCIDYLAYGRIFTHVVFPFVAKEAKNWVFYSRKNAQDVCWEEVFGLLICCVFSFFSGGKTRQIWKCRHVDISADLTFFSRW